MNSDGGCASPTSAAAREPPSTGMHRDRIARGLRRAVAAAGQWWGTMRETEENGEGASDDARLGRSMVGLIICE
jgi:hypothetical protein